MIQVFISYAREDAKEAQRLSRDLAAAGFFPWLDTEQIVPGARWKTAITKALRGSRFVLLILSNHSISKRGYIQKEIREALELLDEFPDSEVFLLPVLVEPCEVHHPRLAELQWVELFLSYEDGLGRIISALSEQATPGSLPPHPPKQARLLRVGSSKFILLSLTLLLFGTSMQVAYYLRKPGFVEKDLRGSVRNPFLPASKRAPQSGDLIVDKLMLSSISDGVGFNAGKGQATVPFNETSPVKVALAEGRPVVVFAWATWCAPCVRELSVLAELQKKYDGVLFLGLNYDRPEDQYYAREITDAEGLRFLYFAVNYHVIKRLFQTEDEIAFPAYVLFGPEGRLSLRFEGSLSYGENLEHLESGLMSEWSVVGKS